MKEPNHFDPKLVLQQLSYTGVLETVKIRKQGYSSRLSFSDFVQRYHHQCKWYYTNESKLATSMGRCLPVVLKAGANDAPKPSYTQVNILQNQSTQPERLPVWDFYIL